jgi:hypothetical protein
MPPRAAIAVLALFLPACVADDPETSETTQRVESRIARTVLAQGETKVWTFDGPMKNGIDPRFEKIEQKNAKDVSFRFGATQQITLTATNAMENGRPANGNVQLLIADLPATGGSHWKAWLSGNVFDSNNKAIGFCGSGNFEKGELHTQVQLAFLDGNDNNGICYCNLCPAKDNHGTWCSTNQWQVGDPAPKISGDGACKAPNGTDHIRVTLEAVAKGEDTNVHHRGTAVFKKVVVGRCNNDGTCPDSMTPNEYGE